MILTSCLVVVLVATCHARLGSVPKPVKEPENIGSIEPDTDKSVNATYWIMCGKSFRRGYDFVCAVKILTGESPVTITITLHNYKGDKIILKSKPQTVLSGVLSTISLPIPVDIEMPSESRWNQRYNTSVSGVGADVNFMRTEMLSLSTQVGAIFVQTDKGIYKTGQTVKFRVLLTDIDLKPVIGEPVDIIIEDPNKNRIWQQLNVKSSSAGAVDQFSFPLARRAQFGRWGITVTAMGMTEEVKFEVDDYVLPRFEVLVDAPSFGLSYNPVLNITVEAKYTFGQPVTEGYVSVGVGSMYTIAGIGQVLRRGVLNSEGKFTVQFSREELLETFAKGSTSLSGRNLRIVANVTEGNTKRTREGSHVIKFFSTPVRAEFLSVTPAIFKPGLPFTAYIEFTRRDKTPLTEAERTALRVELNVTYNVPKQPKTTTTTTTTTVAPTTAKPIVNNSSGLQVGRSPPLLSQPDIYFPGGYYPYQPQEVKILKLDEPVRTVDEKGLMSVTLDIPEDVLTFVTIQVMAQTPFVGTRTSKYLTKAQSPTNSFLLLSVGAAKWRVGDSPRFTAKTTTEVNEIFYQVFNKGMLTHMDSVKSDRPTKTFEFSVLLERRLAPSVKVVAFYRLEDNDEFVVDAISLNVEGLFDNPVSVSFSKPKVQPGEAVDVIVKAPESSWVFLTSNDKSVKLMEKEANDITQDMVNAFLWSLDFGSYFPFFREIFICGGPYYYGAKDASSVLRNAKVIILTDGLVYTSDNYLGMPFATESLRGSAVNNRESLSSSVKDDAFKQPDTVRKFFPENFLWRTAVVGASGQVIIPTQAPHTITSWITTVFSVHPQYGLSIGAKPAELITTRDMFVTLDLPLTIVQGEDYCFTASVFCYHPQPLPVLLTLNKSADFDSIQLRRRGSQVQVQRKSLYYSYFMGILEENDVESAMFCVRPNTVGRVPVQVSALTNVPGLSDAVERIIHVKPEGVPRSSSKSFMVDLSDGFWSEIVDIDFPSDTVPGSQHVTFSATGSFLGPVIDNLDDLLRMPYGCGEQNMLNFAPTVFVTDYYFQTGTIDKEKIEKAKKYMLAGYIKELRYEHEGKGTFSTFGNDDNKQKPGSLWLTAFVTKTFAQGDQLNQYAEVFPLDHRVLSRSIGWISRQMARNGEFVEHGTVFNKRMQGGSATGEALTAYTMIALHEAKKVLENINDTKSLDLIGRSLEQGQTYLEPRVKYIDDPYVACIVGYVLHLTNSRMKNSVFDIIERLATKRAGLKFWQRENSEPKQRYSWSRNTDAISIEATAYCLLVYAERGIETTEGLPVIRWLTTQRGPRGGFISTQDTVIGLQALTRVSANLYSTENIPLFITVSYQEDNGQQKRETINIDKSNEMLLQKIYIPYRNRGPVSVNIEAGTKNGVAGPTPAMAEVAWDYNVKSETTTETYAASHEVALTKNGFILDIKIRTSGPEPASMTILRVDIPSGYKPDMDDLAQFHIISRSDIEYSDERGEDLVIYFNSDVITRDGVQLSIIMDGPDTGKLVNPKDQSYAVINYYNPDDELTTVYSMGEKKPFCEAAENFSFCPYVGRN